MPVSPMPMMLVVFSGAVTFGWISAGLTVLADEPLPAWAMPGLLISSAVLAPMLFLEYMAPTQ